MNRVDVVDLVVDLVDVDLDVDLVDVDLDVDLADVDLVDVVSLSSDCIFILWPPAVFLVFGPQLFRLYLGRPCISILYTYIALSGMILSLFRCSCNGLPISYYSTTHLYGKIGWQR